MTMFEDSPDPDSIVSDLTRLVPVTYGALEVGVAKAHSYFETEGAEIEPFLFSQIVRWSARRHLTTKGRLTVEFEFDELANNGLSISFEGYDIRLRKAFRGGVPTPGSFAMETFHSQTFGFFGDASRPNLFILWDVSRPSYDLAPDLYVACPKESTLKFPNVAECHWLVKLPNVALMPQPAVRVDDFDKYEDLPIHRPLEATGEAE